MLYDISAFYISDLFLFQGETEKNGKDAHSRHEKSHQSFIKHLLVLAELLLQKRVDIKDEDFFVYVVLVTQVVFFNLAKFSLLDSRF